MTTPKTTKEKNDDVSVSTQLSKELHRKLTAIAASEGKSLTALMALAARELAASYERTTKTVTGYARKK